MKYRHKKRGSIYTITTTAMVQASNGPIQEDEVVVVYTNSDGMSFVRRKEEFFDGRFEEVV